MVSDVVDFKSLYILFLTVLWTPFGQRYDTTPMLRIRSTLRASNNHTVSKKPPRGFPRDGFHRNVYYG